MFARNMQGAGRRMGERTPNTTNQKKKMKIYNHFSDKSGNVYSFENYLDFATWYFSKMRKFLVATFDPDTFKKLNRAATVSKEARTPVKISQK
jgi:hypothetical protein